MILPRRTTRYILLGFLILGIGFLGMTASSSFALFVDEKIGRHLRLLLSTLSSGLPLSLTELFLLMLPFLTLLIIFLVIKFRNSRGLLSFLLILFLLYAGIYVTAFAPGKYRPPLEEALGLSPTEPTAEELLGCCLWLSEMAVTSPKPPPEEELIERLMSALQRMGEHYHLPVNSAVRPKGTLTPLLARFGYFGLYAFPLGEVTAVSECPTAVRTFTLAHEMVHASGFSREEEADVLAFLALMDSGDPYLVYAASTGMMGRLLTALEGTSPGAWERASAKVPKEVRRELCEAGDVYDTSAEETVSKETLPYRETVRLLCALYRMRMP